MRFNLALILIHLFILPVQASKSTHLNCGYFDIQAGSPAGTVVAGRLNPKINRFIDCDDSKGDASFAVIGGSGMDYFLVEKLEDSFGHQFGVIKVSNDLPKDLGTYTLQISYRESDYATELIEIEIHAVESTYLEAFGDFVLDAFTNESRMWGRVDVPQSEAARMMDYIVKHNGELPDQDYADPNEGWVGICNTIGGLSRNLVLKGKYGPDGMDSDRQLLRRALYLAYIKLHSMMPVDCFSEYEEIDYSNRSHQWRYTDPLAGSAIFAMKGWLRDMQSDDRQIGGLAKEACEKLLQILNISWQAPSRNRPIPDDKVRYAGYWSDANRDHRMRTWMGLVALLQDYNRPVTYETHWYPHSVGEHAGFSLLPGWDPCGSFFDLQYWVQTSVRPSYYYWTTERSSGFHPDGSISHHTGHGNDMAMFAYGYEWLSDKAIKLSGWFTGTPWEITEPFWTDTASYLTYTIPSIVYKNGYDMAFSGRSHNSPQIEDFGTRNLAKDLQLFLDGKPDSVTLPNNYNIKDLIDSLNSGSHERSINVPFWNGDAMIHRRGGDNDEPYYMSVKMLSTRTRGAEGFGPDKYSYHMGDGMFQVKARGDEYLGAQFDWDWHVLPGTTAEWRTDTLPMAKSTYDYPTGKNNFAGVVSNGHIGAASFVFDRSEDPYASVVANKSYFFLDDFSILVGSGIKRVHPGQGNAIVTTIDQANWVADINYSINGEPAKVVSLNSNEHLVFDITDLTWFHHGQIGYVIWPNPNTPSTQVILKTGSKISDTDIGRSGKHKVFHLAINHGTNPDPPAEQYAYSVIPNVAAETMPSFISRLKNQLQVIIDKSNHHAVSDTNSKISLVSFFEPGAITFTNGLSVEADHASMILLRERPQHLEVALSDPEHRPDSCSISCTINKSLRSGNYAYQTAGVFSMPAEMAEAAPIDTGTRLIFQLPDKTDKRLYANRYEMYYGMPAAVTIPFTAKN